MPYTPKTSLDAQSVAGEFKRMAEGQKANNVAANATVNGSDAATTQALANSLKTTVNNILTELKAAGLMKTS